jgi:hypothetical protein
MVPWVVIASDAPGCGRGVRGQTLAWFLRTYFGRRHVALRRPGERRAPPARATEAVFVGLPTSLEPDQIRAIAAPRVIPFDYLDAHELAWTESQAVAFRERTDVYLKPWFEPAWDYGLRMGMLPIRRYARFTAALFADRLLGRRRRSAAPQYDVAFLGRPNYTRLYVDGRIEAVEQRVEWMLELKRHAPDLKVYGGLVEVDAARRTGLEQRYGPLDDLWAADVKVGFSRYYRTLQNSRVLLAPGGNVPWTYRHYECLYSGAVVATIDYRSRDMLVPLPRDLMEHVPDRGPLLPSVRAALERSHQEPDLAEQVYRRLEQYLRWGAYHRSRRALLDRFLSQLDR